MPLGSEEALRIFMLTGLPQAYTYSRVIGRAEQNRREKTRRDEPQRA